MLGIPVLGGPSVEAPGDVRSSGVPLQRAFSEILIFVVP